MNCHIPRPSWICFHFDMRPQQSALYSWRDDPTIPAFDDTRILVVMDAECALCSAAARRIASLDQRDQVRIATSQSPVGKALLRHFDLAPTNPETWLMLSAGRAFGSLDAMTRLFPSLSRRYAPIKALRLLPVALQDWVYARIARNRYALWGHGDMCAMPDPELQRRLVSR